MYNNGNANLLQYIFNDSLLNQKISTRCRSLKAEGIYGAISEARCFVSWYRHRFCGPKLKYVSRWCLDILSFTDVGLHTYQIWKIYSFFLLTLDGLASIIWRKQSMNFLHSVLFTAKMGSKFPLLSATSLIASKKYPAVIGSICKWCNMLP